MKVLSIRKVHIENSRMRAVAQVMFDDGSVMNDIRIIEGDNGPFIAFPSNNIDDELTIKPTYDKMKDFEKILLVAYHDIK